MRNMGKLPKTFARYAKFMCFVRPEVLCYGNSNDGSPA